MSDLHGNSVGLSVEQYTLGKHSSRIRYRHWMVIGTTGIETRQALNTSRAGTKTGLLENLKIIIVARSYVLVSFYLSVGLVLALNGFGPN